MADESFSEFSSQNEHKKKKKSKKKKQVSDCVSFIEKNNDNENISIGYLFSPHQSFTPTSLKDLRKRKEQEYSPDVKKKKKHKAEKVEQNADGMSESTFMEEVSHNENFQSEDTDINKHKKKKKKKRHSVLEETLEEQDDSTSLVVQEPCVKSKKKKKKLYVNEDYNDVVTLDMLDNSSTVSISELADKIATGAQKSSTLLSEDSSKNTTVVAKDSVSTVKNSDKQSKEKPGKKSKAKALVKTNAPKLAKTKKKGSSKIAQNSSLKVLSQDSGNGSDVDGALEDLNSSEMNQKENDNDYMDDPEAQTWLNSLKDDLVEDKLDFEPCELHTRHNKMKGLSAEEKNILSQDGIELRMGKWSPKEDKVIRENMEKFVTRYNVPSKCIPIILGINKYGKQTKTKNKLAEYLIMKKFCFYLAKDLNLRTLYSAYQRARKLYHPMNKGKLNKEQLAQMFRLQAKVGNKWSTISEMMNKPSKMLNAAARYYTDKKEMGEWTAEENEKLVEAVKNKMKMRSDGSLKKLPWKKIAKKVGSRTDSQCYKQWFHNLCWKFSHGDTVKPKWTDEDSLRLIQHLYASEAETEADLDWDYIFSQFSKSGPVSTKQVGKKSGGEAVSK